MKNTLYKTYLQGKIILKQILKGSTIEINQQLKLGIYFVKIQNNKFNQSQKLIIQ